MLYSATQEIGVWWRLCPGNLQFIAVASHHFVQEKLSTMIKSADYSFFHYCAHPFLSRFSFPTSPLYPHSIPFHLPVLFLYYFFLSSIIHHSTSHRISVSMLIDFRGLAMERDIKSGLWLCMCLQPRLWLTGMLIQLSGVFSVFLSSFFLFFFLLRNL